MSIQERDYLKKLIEQFAAALARIAGLKNEGKLEDAEDCVHSAAEEAFGALASTLDSLDAKSAAEVLGHRQKLGIYAALTGELADICARDGRQKHARSKYRRALELQLASLAVYPEGTEQTKTAIRALRAKLVLDDLPAELRSALDALVG